jgi:two-component system, cell cycle sensor histidine kinase and response regulator CckA
MGVRGARPAAAADGPKARNRRHAPLRAYVAGLVVLFVLAAGANIVYQRQAAASDARQAATAEAVFGARSAASGIATDIALVRTQVATLAANPAIVRAFTAQSGCTLQFGGAGAFGTGHMDIVGNDGKVACSSLAPRKSPGYARATWLPAALRGPTVAGPVADPRTGQLAVLVAAPVPGKGAVVVFLNLGALGPGLASTLSGPLHLEFVVTSANDKVVLAQSIDPARWVGRPVAGTPFAGTAVQAQRRGLDGISRIYGQAAVAKLGWRVFAGASTSTALAAANRLNSQQLAITLVGLLVFLAAAMVFYRRIARPIAKLSAGVRAATGHASADPIAVAGPAEVLTLVDDFNHLITAASRELESAARLAAIVESSSDAMVGTTLDGVVTSWNAGAELMYGYTADEMIGRNASRLLPPERADDLMAMFERMRRGERAENFETKRLRKDGSIIDVSISCSPIQDANGTVVGASAVSRDMTERNRAEAERRGLEGRLHQSERLESLGQLAGGIAHDFNNLLAAIMNYAGFVAEETADMPAVRADVEQIQAAAQRAARLTKQLLMFSRREATQSETLDLNAIVADIRDLLSRSIGTHIRLSVELAVDPPAVEADRGQVEQVLLNLAINARDAMPKGGILTIETSLAELDQGYARMHPGVSPGRYVELVVRDTGTGMSPEVAARIFEPFFTTKPRDQGTGLGLVTVYGIVTQAGGSMSVESEEGTGTTFRLYFPAAGATTAATPAAPVPEARGNGQTVLVVDDEPAVLEVASRILRQNGYAALEAATYEEALSLATAHRCQLLLTDSVMPHMSGATLAERVGRLNPGLAILYMSGYSEGMAGPSRVAGQGAARIQKPFDQQTLLEAVRAVLKTAPPA